MDKKTRIPLLVIGFLSLISGVYLAVTGSDFTDYFFGIFIGLTLIGSVYFISNDSEEDAPD